MRKKVLALVLAVLVATAGAGAWQHARRGGPARTAARFTEALCSGDARGAARLACGAALFRLRNSGPLPRAEVARLAVSVPRLGRNWAEAEVFAELVLQDGSRDAGWYRLELVREEAWKVASASEAGPWPRGLWPFAGREDAREAGEVFASYLRDLAAGRYAEAARHLCGPARRAHERGAAVLGKGPLFKKLSGPRLDPLWRRGDTMACRAEYEVDGRSVSVVVKFLKLGDGWHVLGVTQL